MCRLEMCTYMLSMRCYKYSMCAAYIAKLVQLFVTDGGTSLLGTVRKNVLLGPDLSISLSILSDINVPFKIKSVSVHLPGVDLN